MPEPIPDLNRDHQCYHYQAPSGQRCGSPALKGEYYCYHHLRQERQHEDNRVLIDPEVTSHGASSHRGPRQHLHRPRRRRPPPRREHHRHPPRRPNDLRPASRHARPRPPRLPSAPRTNSSSNQKLLILSAAQRSRKDPERPRPPKPQTPLQPPQPATDDLQPATPKTIQITKESLLYFLRSRHCYNCNTELFPPKETTYRRHPGAPAEAIEEAHQTLPPPPPATDNPQPVAVLPTFRPSQQPIARNPAHRTQAQPAAGDDPLALSSRRRITVRCDGLAHHIPRPLCFTLS